MTISRDENPLNDDSISRVLAVVRTAHKIDPNALQLAAGTYLELKRRSANSKGRGLRNDLRIISKHCRRIAHDLDRMPLQVELIMLASRRLSPSDTNEPMPPKPATLSEQLIQTSEAIDTFLDRAKGRLVGFDPTFQMTCSLLEIAYFHGVGRPASHTTVKDGQHVGEPLSEFGRFVTAFFREVDPSVTPVSLNTVLRAFVHDPTYRERRQPPS